MQSVTSRVMQKGRTQSQPCFHTDLQRAPGEKEEDSNQFELDHYVNIIYVFIIRFCTVVNSGLCPRVPVQRLQAGGRCDAQWDGCV